MGAEPPCTPADELVPSAQIFEGELLETKLRAIRSMTSQVEPLIAALGEDFFREGMAEEAFRAPLRPCRRHRMSVAACAAPLQMSGTRRNGRRNGGSGPAPAAVHTPPKPH